MDATSLRRPLIIYNGVHDALTRALWILLSAEVMDEDKWKSEG